MRIFSCHGCKGHEINIWCMKLINTQHLKANEETKGDSYGEYKGINRLLFDVWTRL